MSFGLQVSGCGLQVQSCGLRVAGSNLKQETRNMKKILLFIEWCIEGLQCRLMISFFVIAKTLSPFAGRIVALPVNFPKAGRMA